MGLWSKMKGFFGRIGKGIGKAAKGAFNVGKGLIGKFGQAAGTAIGAAYGAPQVGTAIGGLAQNVANTIPNVKV